MCARRPHCGRPAAPRAGSAFNLFFSSVSASLSRVLFSFFGGEPCLVADDDFDHCWAGDVRLRAGIVRAPPQAQEKAISPETPAEGLAFFCWGGGCFFWGGQIAECLWGCVGGAFISSSGSWDHHRCCFPSYIPVPFFQQFSRADYHFFDTLVVGYCCVRDGYTVRPYVFLSWTQTAMVRECLFMSCTACVSPPQQCRTSFSSKLSSCTYYSNPCQRTRHLFLAAVQFACSFAVSRCALSPHGCS